MLLIMLPLVVYRLNVVIIHCVVEPAIIFNFSIDYADKTHRSITMLITYTDLYTFHYDCNYIYCFVMIHSIIIHFCD